MYTPLDKTGFSNLGMIRVWINKCARVSSANTDLDRAEMIQLPHHAPYAERMN